MLRMSSRLFGKALVVIEHTAGVVAPSTLAAITAASKCGDVVALVAAKDSKAVAAQVQKIAGVKEVLSADGDHFAHGLPEELAPLVAAVAKSSGATHVLAGASAFGKSVIPRVAAAFDAMPISDITAVVSDSSFVRLAYAGNVVTTVKSTDAVKFITVRGTSFVPAEVSSGIEAPLSVATVTAPKGQSKWLEDVIVKSDKPALETAKVVVSGGRGFKNKENFFKLMDDLSGSLGAGVGCTRAMVDAGYCPNEMQVGQTGKVVAPSLYIAIGLSGAIQHVAGMKDAKVIAAINTDAEAPIFAVSDYGLVEDLFKAVPKLTELTKKK